MTVLLFVALVAPMVLWVFWQSTVKTVYAGPAQAVGASVLIGPKRGDSPQHAFVSVEVPELGVMIAEISVARAKAIAGNAVFPVEVVVCRALSTKPYIESVKWGGSGEVERSTVDGAALLVSLAYFVLGGLALAQGSPAGSEVAFICSGFVAGWSQLRYKRISGGLVFALLLTGALFGFGSLACFQQINILTFFPGVVLAFAFGQVGGMLAAAWGRD
jgi:hypothetical protein